MRVIQGTNLLVLEKRNFALSSAGALLIIVPLALGCVGIFIEKGSEAVGDSNAIMKNLTLILMITLPIILLGLWLLSKPYETAYVFDKERQEYAIEARSLFGGKKDGGSLTAIKAVNLSKSLSPDNYQNERYLFTFILFLDDQSSTPVRITRSLFSLYWEGPHYPLQLAATITTFLNLPEPQIVNPDVLADVDKWFAGIADKIDKKI